MLNLSLLGRTTELPPWLWRVLGCVVLVAASFYYHHPSERILGQSDAAAYAYSGVAFARGEGFGPQRPLLDTMLPEVRECVVETRFPMGLRDAAPKLRPRPFYLEWQIGEKKPGNLVPRFPPGYPTILALGYRLAGWEGLLAVNGVLILLAGLLVMYLAGKWAGPVAGFLAASIWAVFPLNIWIGNTTLAEPLVLLLGLAGVAAWVRALESRNSSWPLLLGICVGMAPLAKLDAIPWLALPLMYAWEARRQGLWRACLPVLTMTPCLGVSAVILFNAGSGYTWENVITLIKQPAVRVVIAVGAMGLIGGVIAVWKLQLFAREEVLAEAGTQLNRCSRWTTWLKWIFFSGAVGALIYLYFVRPRWAGSDQIYWAPMGCVVPTLRELTLQRLGWYLPPVALWVAMVSAVAAALWVKETWMRTFATIGLIILFFISYDHIDFPAQPFGLRHFVPQAIPVLVISLAGASHWLVLKPEYRRWGQGIIGVLVLYAIGCCVAVDQKMNPRSDAEGLITQFQSIADTVGPGAIVALRQSNPLIEIAPMLAFGFQRDIMPLQTRNAQDRQSVENYLRAQEQAGRSIWLWTSAADDTLGFPVQVCETASQRDFSVPFLHTTTTEHPFSWDRRTWKSVLRRVSFSEAGGTATTSKAKQP